MTAEDIQQAYKYAAAPAHGARRHERAGGGAGLMRQLLAGRLGAPSSFQGSGSPMRRGEHGGHGSHTASDPNGPSACGTDRDADGHTRRDR